MVKPNLVPATYVSYEWLFESGRSELDALYAVYVLILCSVCGRVKRVDRSPAARRKPAVTAPGDQNRYLRCNGGAAGDLYGRAAIAGGGGSARQLARSGGVARRQADFHNQVEHTT